jgi:hypothetical protein
MNGNITVNATFTEIPEYTLKVNIIGSGVVSVNGSSPYDAGDVVMFSAFPSAGWEFSGWSGNLTGSDTPEYRTMNGNITVNATFTEIPEIRDRERFFTLYLIRFVSSPRCSCLE